MLNLLICDDEREHLEALGEIVSSTRFASQIRVSTANSTNDIRILISKGMNIDILLADIELGTKSGIELVKVMHSYDPLIQVIYVTGHDKYHTKAYETEHVCFLRKPVKPEDMEMALELAFERQRQIEENVICIAEKSKTERIKLASIRYIEGVARKTIIYADDGAHEFSRRLAEIEEMLDGRFVKCHKSFIINLQRVRRMTYASFELESEEIVPISQGMQKKTKEAFLKFIGDNR